MKLPNSYWYFKNAFSIKHCDRILKLCNTKKDQKATVQTVTDGDKLKKIRDSNVVWLSKQWIYNMLFPFLHLANKEAGWIFEFDYAESCQFTKYKKNQHYNWHQDSTSPYINARNENFNGKIRKLSSGLILSNPEDYKGGEFQFNYNSFPPNMSKKNIATLTNLSKGSLLCFPSHIWHRVKPVTQGTRYSLTTWYLGKPFK